jgi:alpha-L-rhamnosidase
MGLAGAATAMLATACSNATTTAEQKAEEPTNPAQEAVDELDKGHEVVSLTVNGLVDPMGIEGVPTFGWAMASDAVGARQASYQLVVSDAAGKQVWDSGVVEGAESQNIAYGGDALDAKSRYTWKVTVTDVDGNELESREGSFATALADGTIDSWQGAQWIGSERMYFDAAVTNYFSLDATITIPADGTRAGIVLGADDYRLANEAMNIWGKAGQSRFVYEVDVTNAKKPQLNIYVVGMPAFEAQNDGDETKPAYVVSIPKKALAEKAVHDPIQVNINTLAEVNQVNCSINGVVVDEARQINPLGNTHDYNTFPNLGKIGFAVPAGETATFTDVALRYPGSYEEKYEVGDLFSKTAGATYAIFEDLDGVSLDGDDIVVKAGDEDVFVCADPSFGSAPMVRTEFETTGEVASATLYAAAQGIYELSINGQRVGEGWHSPGCEDYAAHMPYRVYDVTELVASGNNAFGAQLAEGWWSGYQSYTITNWSFYGAKQALLAMLEVTYADGTTQTVVTDPASWKVFDDGPVRAASNFHGERYDATVAAELDGWDKPGFDASAWGTPVVLEPRQNEFEFCTRYDAEGHVVGELTAVECLGEAKQGSGSYIYDMGENVMGVPQLTIPADYVDEGALVTVRFAEVLYPDLKEYQDAGIVGLMMVENLRAAMVTDFYVATAGDQVFEPHFTYRGYRYVEVTGLKKALPAENVKLIKLSSIDVTSTYEGSNELVTRLFKNVQNSQTSNFLSLPTDCPQRNERMGWTGDAQVFSATAAYNADVYGFYRNWLRTLRDQQRGDGSLPVYAPTFEPVAPAFMGGWEGTSWDAALMVIPYVLWQQTANDAIVRDNIDAIDRYLAYLEATPLLIPSDETDITKGENVPELTGHPGFLADWLSIDATDANLINEAMYVYLLGISSTMAKAIGRDELAQKWDERYQSAKAKWNELYVDPKTGKTTAPASLAFDYQTFGMVFVPGSDQDTEASYATPLAFGVFDEKNEQTAADNLVEAVTRAGHTITSGFSGTPFLVPMLTRYGNVDDAYKLFEQEEYASWLYPVKNGATSVWERWNSYTVEDGFGGNNSMNSFDHFSLGAIAEWMMRYHLGIDHDEAGWQNFVLAPVVGGSFTSAKGSFQSPWGTIESGWEAKDGALVSYAATVPANTSATLYLPVDEDAAAGAELPEGVTYVGADKRNGIDCAVFQAESGTFELKF